ncbi:CoA pyrophosphatase [Corynebacterium sp. TAE3-ERU12]|uniref:NUDIX hydrolase n=1 Tax=Corynebacterium sp. TAE3-ERU12 TaxID=2849491 RepID=UPI001C4835CD|nr:CoA pyrophosphatase [Corynebacterium sp. TAE3-ERU12]MBV7294480.1 CoA pyrophosphatase [Corynebacterium sp. TAE3-ERU12]
MSRFDREIDATAAPPWLATALRTADTDMEQLRQRSSTLREPLLKPRSSAVLVLLSGDPTATARPQDASVVITHRAPTLRSHAGQMAFPGGKVDPGDTNLVHTALREAEEETGLDPATVSPLHVLDSIDISRTGFAVHPVLAHWRAPHPLRVVDPAETDAVLDVRIDDLLNPENRLMVGFAGWSGPAFRVGEFIVWGFTGGVLSHLFALAGWAQDWDDSTVHDLRETLAASANQEAFTTEGKLR